MAAFSTSRDAKELLSTVLSKGQDLACLKCRCGTLRWQDPRQCSIPCDSCGQTKPATDFDDRTQAVWKTIKDNPEKQLRWFKCQGKTRGRRGEKFVLCTGDCNRRVPEYHFEKQMLQVWRNADKKAIAKCARCYLKRQDPQPTLQLTCLAKACQKKKPIWDSIDVYLDARNLRPVMCSVASVPFCDVQSVFPEAVWQRAL